MARHGWRVDKAPGQNMQTSECTFRRSPIGRSNPQIVGLYGIRYELVKQQVLSFKHTLLKHYSSSVLYTPQGAVYSAGSCILRRELRMFKDWYWPCDFSGFFPISGFFTNLPLPQNFLERREVATKERKKWPVLCPNSLVSCLWGCGESVNPPKSSNIQEVIQCRLYTLLKKIKGTWWAPSLVCGDVESVNPPKFNQKSRMFTELCPLPIFQDFILLLNHTPECKSALYPLAIWRSINSSSCQINKVVSMKGNKVVCAMVHKFAYICIH